MKKIITTLFLAAFSPAVLADGGYGMMGYGMMGGTGKFGMSLFGVLYFVLIAFVFSVIFWGTHNWLVKDQKNKKKK